MHIYLSSFPQLDLMHYFTWIFSRNTVQKQWDETLVLVLGGIARLLRSFFPLLSDLSNFWSGGSMAVSLCVWYCYLLPLFIMTILCKWSFSAGWESLLLLLRNSILNGSKEVAIAAINCLQTTVHSHCSKVIIFVSFQSLSKISSFHEPPVNVNMVVVDSKQIL